MSAFSQSFIQVRAPVLIEVLETVILSLLSQLNLNLSTDFEKERNMVVPQVLLINEKW